MRRRRSWTWLLIPAIAGVGGYFALFGGEYSVFDVRDLRDQTEVRSAELAALRAENDSLAAYADSLEHDPATLEAVARGEHGLARRDELIYKYGEMADSAALSVVDTLQERSR